MNVLFRNVFFQEVLKKGDQNMTAKSKDQVRYVFTAYITLPNGRRLYAKERGLKAFRIPVSDDDLK